MKNRHRIFICALILTLGISSCQKRKTNKIIEGTWRVKSMTLDDINVLNKIIDSLTNPQCDSLMHIEQGYYDISITFKKDGTYQKNTDFHIATIDTALFMQNCSMNAILKTETEVENGKWELFGKSTLQMITDKNSEGNKLININDDYMDWETDVVVSQGVVVFNGIKKTKWKKE